MISGQKVMNIIPMVSYVIEDRANFLCTFKVSGIIICQLIIIFDNLR